jgi:hypothetical protein
LAATKWVDSKALVSTPTCSRSHTILPSHVL